MFFFLHTYLLKPNPNYHIKILSHVIRLNYTWGDQSLVSILNTWRDRSLVSILNVKVQWSLGLGKFTHELWNNKNNCTFSHLCPRWNWNCFYSKENRSPFFLLKLILGEWVIIVSQLMTTKPKLKGKRTLLINWIFSHALPPYFLFSPPPLLKFTSKFQNFSPFSSPLMREGEYTPFFLFYSMFSLIY